MSIPSAPPNPHSLFTILSNGLVPFTPSSQTPPYKSASHLSLTDLYLQIEAHECEGQQEHVIPSRVH